MFQLRQSLASPTDEAQIVETSGAGYRLDGDAVEIDVTRFRT